jgi:hypothetical protein
MARLSEQLKATLVEAKGKVKLKLRKGALTDAWLMAKSIIDSVPGGLKRHTPQWSISADGPAANIGKFTIVLKAAETKHPEGAWDIFMRKDGKSFMYAKHQTSDREVIRHVESFLNHAIQNYGERKRDNR